MSRKTTFKFKGSFDKEKLLRNLKIDAKEAKSLGIHLGSDYSTKSLRIHKFEPIEEEGSKPKILRLPSIKGLNLNELPLKSQPRQKSKFYVENNEEEEESSFKEKIILDSFKVNKDSYNNMRLDQTMKKSEILDTNLIKFRRKILSNIKTINSNIRVINAISQNKTVRNNRNPRNKAGYLNYIKNIYTVRTDK